MQLDTLIITLAAVPLWIVTGLIGFYYRRWMIFLAFTLAGLNTIPRAIVFSGGHIAPGLAAASAWLGVPIVGLICGAYLGGRPKQRPGSWTT